LNAKFNPNNFLSSGEEHDDVRAGQPATLMTHTIENHNHQ